MTPFISHTTPFAWAIFPNHYNHYNITSPTECPTKKPTKLTKARENAGDQGMIRASYPFDWLREWRELFGPIIERSKAKPIAI